jgi:hypothetical protein
MNIAERFWSKVDKSGDCWMWTGKPMNKGYGIFSADWREPNVLAHRWAYAEANGPIPPGMVVDHECHNDTDCPGGDTCPHRLCVTPSHLKLETVADNVSKSHLAGAKKTHCRNGHEFTPETTFVRKNGWRNCLICKRESNRNSRKRMSAVTWTPNEKEN